MFECPVKCFPNFLSSLSRKSSKTLISGKMNTRRCSIAALCLTVFLNLKFLAVSTFCFACPQYSEAAEFVFGKYTILISTNVASILSKNDYTVSVSTGDLTLSRLTVACDYENITAFVADLDLDSKFEVIVVSGRAKSSLDAFTWTGHELQKFDISTEVESVPGMTRLQNFYEVKKNKLVQQFKVSSRGGQSGPVWKTYIYSVIDKKWVFVAD